MKVYKNKTGTYDVLVTPQNLLFHVNNGRSKFIGRVSSAWRHNEPQMKRTPTKVLEPFIFELAKNGNFYKTLILNETLQNL